MSNGADAKHSERRSPGDDTGVGLDVDRVLAAAGLDAPAEESELDLDVDFDLDDVEESELEERLPFRFATPPVLDTPPTGVGNADVDPFANTIGEPARLTSATPLNAMRAVAEESDPDVDQSGTHFQVAEMLQSRMKQRGYTPIGTPVALNSVPDVARDAISQASPALQPRSEQVATRDVGVVRADADAYDTREVLVQAPDPFEDEDDGDAPARPIVARDVPQGPPVPEGPPAPEAAAADSRKPTPMGVRLAENAPANQPSRERARGADDTQPIADPLGQAAATEAAGASAKRAAALEAERAAAATQPIAKAPPAPGVPGEQATQMLDDLPVEALARQRRDSLSKSKKSERRRVRHGEDERVLGRATLGAREVSGVKEERNTARERSVEALLREYVETPVEPVPDPDAEGPVPGAQVFKRRRRRR